MNGYINKKSRILIVGSKEKFTLDHTYYKTLKHLGYKVDFLNVEKSLNNRMIAKIKIYLTRLNYKILREKILLFFKKKKEQYELIIFFKSIFLDYETICKIKSMNSKAKFVNIFPDDPFNIYNPIISNKNFLKTMPKYDLFCIWSYKLKKKLENKFETRILYLPFGYDSLNVSKFKIKTKKIRDEVSFIGTYDQDRLNIINSIKIKKNIYGGNWWRYSGRSLNNSIVGKHIYGNQIFKLMNETAISLNVLRKQNLTSHNMKTFEIPANNGLMLTTRSKEQNKFFKENLGCYMYSSKKELNKKIKFILKNPQKAAKVRKYGNLIVKKYSYIRRVKFLLKEVNRKKNGS